MYPHKNSTFAAQRVSKKRARHEAQRSVYPIAIIDDESSFPPSEEEEEDDDEVPCSARPRIDEDPPVQDLVTLDDNNVVKRHCGAHTEQRVQGKGAELILPDTSLNKERQGSLDHDHQRDPSDDASVHVLSGGKKPRIKPPPPPYPPPMHLLLKARIKSLRKTARS